MDDDQKLQKLLADAYAKAPKPVQEFVDSGALEAFLNRLPKDFGLSAEESAAAASEITLAVFGLTAATELPAYLSTYAGVEDKLMDKLVAALDESVFAPLKKKVAGSAPVAPVSRPVAPITPPPPLNRLSGTSASTPATKPEPPKITVPAIKPVVPPPAPKPPAPPAVKAPPPAPVEAKPVSPTPPKPPTPPLVAPTPPAVVEKKRPEESPPTPSVAPSSVRKTDPYREPIE